MRPPRSPGAAGAAWQAARRGYLMEMSFTPRAGSVKGSLALRKVSDFRTSEVCRRNPTWLNTLHHLQNRGVFISR